MVNDVLIIKAKSLKDLLALFPVDSALENLSLGDTWHPSSGFVDEGILEGKTRVGDVLGFDYDFRGLVAFEAEIGAVQVVMKTPGDGKWVRELYELSGPKGVIQSIRNRLKALGKPVLEFV